MKKVLVLVIALISTVINSCPLHIKNDTNQSVLLVEADGDYAQLVNPGDVAVVGNTEKHLCFYLFKPGAHPGVLTPICTVAQHTCTANKKVESTVSAIINGKLDTTFFGYGKNATAAH